VLRAFDIEHLGEMATVAAVVLQACAWIRD